MPIKHGDIASDSSTAPQLQKKNNIVINLSLFTLHTVRYLTGNF
jgi:hypothetical protein